MRGAWLGDSLLVGSGVVLNCEYLNRVFIVGYNRLYARHLAINADAIIWVVLGFLGMLHAVANPLHY